MRRRILNRRQSVAAVIAVSVSFAMAPSVSRADLTFYTSSPAFNAAAPGLPVETFGAANLSGQTYVTQPNGLSAATNDGVFALGSIRPGLTVSTLNPGLQSNALEVEGGVSGGKSVGTNYFQDTLVLGFGPGVSAVGETVFGQENPGMASLAGTVTEDVFSGSTHLGSKTVNEAAGASVFLGVTSTTAAITSVQLFFNPTADMDSGTFATNVAFGTPSVVPEPSSLALSAIALGLVGLRVASSLRRWVPPGIASA